MIELWRLLAHQHWFTLKIFKREVRLCARCSGYVAGLYTFKVFNNLLGIPIFNSLNNMSQLFLCFLSIIPLTSDWLTQSWKWRDSNNRLRFITGTLLGIGVILLSLCEVPVHVKNLLYIYTLTIIVSLGSVGRLLTCDYQHYSRSAARE